MNKRLIPIFAAALTVLLLAGCGVGGDSVQDNATPEGLQTFGVAVNPSAQPSVAQEVSPAVNANTAQDGTTVGELGQTDQGESVSPRPSTTPSQSTSGSSTTTKPTATAKPTTRPNPTTQPSVSPSTSPSTSPTTSPVISPPQPATTATYDEVKQYVGKQLSALVSELGYPVRSDYDYVDEEDPSKGENGTLYFSGGFTVTTLRNSDGEVVTGISQE